MTLAQRLTARPSKYRSQPTVVDGIRFASKAEARRYAELKLLEKAGKIERLELQPRYRLFAPARGKHVCLGEYRGDFFYWDHDLGMAIVEDVKGFATPLYRWKKKHVEAQYGVTITEVKRR